MWIPGIPTQSSQMLKNPAIVSGSAVFYGPQVMEATAKSKDLNLDRYIDGVSLLTCGDIGKPVWIKRPNHGWQGPFLVVDCAKRGDLYGIINYRKEAVEVGFNTALKWNMADIVDYERGKYSVSIWKINNVLVSKYPPRMIKNTEVENMRDWFNSSVRFSTEEFDNNNCTLQYKPPISYFDLPLWRINCRWMRLFD